MSRWKKILLWAGGGLLGLLALLAITGFFVIRSDWFHDKVKSFLVAKIEEASGGKVEIGSYQFDYRNLTATINNFVLHGTEPAREAPLLKADKIEVALKILSVWKKDVDLHSILVDRPQVNLIIDKDGKTNIPSPKVQTKSDKDPIETLLDVAVKYFEVRDGLLRVRDEAIPLNARGEHFSAKLNYDTAGPRYLSDVQMHQLHLSTDKIQPLAADVTLSAILEKGHVQVTKLLLGMKESEIQITGDLRDFQNPKAGFDVHANVSLAELRQALQLDEGSQGRLALNGKVSYSGPGNLTFQSTFNGQGLTVKQGTTRVDGNLDGDGQVTSNGSGFQVNAKVNGRPLTIHSGTTLVSGDLMLNAQVVPEGKGYKIEANLHGPQMRVKSGTTSVAGAMNVNAAGTFLSADDYHLTGKAALAGIDLRQPGTHITNAKLDTSFNVTPKLVALTNLNLAALGGTFSGEAALKDSKAFDVKGNLKNFSLQTLAQTGLSQKVGYSGTISGPVSVSGLLTKNGVANLQADTQLQIAAGPGGLPLRGTVSVHYDPRTKTVQLGNSNLNFPNSQLTVSGTLGQRLEIHLVSRNLNDFLPAIAAATGKPAEPLPITLQGGVAQFDGTVTGAMEVPQIAGTVQLTKFAAEGRSFDSLNTTFTANKSGVQVPTLTAKQGQAVLTANADIGLSDWKLVDASAIKASAQLKGGQLAKLVAQNGAESPVDGIVTAQLQANGTMKTLQATAALDVDQVTGFGESFDRLHADMKYAAGSVDLVTSHLDLGAARLALTANYSHAPSDFENGRIKFNLTSNRFNLAQFKAVQATRPGLTGDVELNAAGVADVRKMQVLLADLNGRAALTNVALNKQAIGNISVDAKTNSGALQVTASGDLRGTRLSGNANVQLAGDYQGQGQLQLGALTISKFQDLMAAAGSTSQLPLDGTIAGKATFDGPLAKPDAVHARVELSRVEVSPLTPAGRLKLSERAITIKNTEPVVFDIRGQTITVQSAKFQGEDTDLSLSGTASLDPKVAWNLDAKGALNLKILSVFNPDVEATGKSTLAATIRGTMNNPLVNGRLDLTDAAVHVADVTSGLEHANGTILFDRNRATIQKFTSQMGGGTLTAGGYVVFGGPDVIYRLQATADQVRYRQEGVSVTVDANMNLGGSTSSSVLSGLVTVRRAGFNSKTDVGGLLATAAKPVPATPTKNDFLRNMRLDIRVESVPNLQFSTSLTSNVQAEVDLRVKGTAERPVVLNTITVNQGEINFFGTKYTINRGQIGFFNPVKIEPVIDLDLTTTARGVEVTINFSGPITKLNMSYRSDPPLQSNEIIALLAVGREPNTNPALASSQTVSTTSVFQTGANSLLGQAVGSPVSNRLQRFFGVSKLKIDPQLSGVDNVPQARLTLEQQVSTSITITFITNLTRAQDQSFRFQYDINKNFAIIAVRDENGILGIDAQYKRRFK